MLPPPNELAPMFVMLFHQVQGQQSLRTVVMTDVAGFTELMSSNEPQTLPLLRADMEVIRAHISRQDGEVVKISGDGLLALFSSAPKAVRACIDAQEELSGSPLKHRMAIHAGEVTVSGGDAYGDAVNICSRIEALTIPGTVSASKIVIDLVRSQDLPHPHKTGKVQLKGVEAPMEMYCWGDARKFSNKKRTTIFIASGVAGLVILGGFYVNSTNTPPEGHRGKTLPRPQFGGRPSNVNDTNMAVGADDILDQAYDEVWKEIEDFDNSKEEAIKKRDPKIVLDWLKNNPMGQRDRGKLETEHWSLVSSAMTEGKKIVGENASPEAIISALQSLKDPSMDLALKAFAEEFRTSK